MAEHLKFKDTIFCPGKWTGSTLCLTTWIWSWGWIWSKWCISNVWKCAVEMTENIMAVSKVSRLVLWGCDALLWGTEATSERVNFLWTLTRREESERKKVSSLQTLKGNSSLSVLPRLSLPSPLCFCLPCLPSLFHAHTKKEGLNEQHSYRCFFPSQKCYLYGSVVEMIGRLWLFKWIMLLS